MNEEEALLEIVQKRRTLRQSLVDWSKAAGFIPSFHHLFILDKLEKVVRGELPYRKIMLLCPPGTAKSTYASVVFPPWYLAQKPGQAILACSHSQEFAEGFGRKCRNLVAAYSPNLGYELAKDSQAATKWAISNGGYYFGTSVGAGLAGNRADLGLIDDPIGKREDVLSESFRQKSWDWYNFDFLTRLKPDALQVFIYTPWHTDDLGHQILQRDGKEWLVIRLPFYAEENDPLGRAVGDRIWPEYTKDEQFPKEASVANALYQLRPTSETGNFFKKEMLKGYELRDLPPKDQLRYYCASDHAISEKQESDYTVFMPVAVDHSDNVWILPDVYRAKVPTDQAIEASLRLVRKYRFMSWFAESGHISKSIGPFWRKRLRECRLFLNIVEISATKDKMSRAQSIHGRASMGMVFFPKFSPIWPDFEHELLSFPVSKHDDLVDALAHIGSGLDTLMGGSAPPKEEVEEFNKPFVPTMRWLKEEHRQTEYHKMLLTLDR